DREIYATNNAGNILAGSCYLWPNYKPYVWINGAPVQFATLPGCSSFEDEAVALAMNNSGFMAGWGTAAPDCWSAHAILWAPAPVDLGPGIAYAISGDKWIVGVNGSGQGFLRVSDPVCPLAVSLNLLLDSSGNG